MPDDALPPPAAPQAPEPQVNVVTPLLYQAALGELNAAHYLAAFARFDATGRALAGWNWGAALCAPLWLALRRLWPALLAYLAAWALLALALFFVGHRWLALPAPLLAGVALAALVLLCGVPGLYGDALLHGQVQRRIRSAVLAAPSMQEALALLQRQRVDRTRLYVVAGAGALAALLALALVWQQGWWALEGAAAEQAASSIQGAVVAEPLPAPAPAPAQALTPPEPPAAEPEHPPERLPEPAPEPAPPPPSPTEAPATRSAAAANGPGARALHVNVGLFADPANARRAHRRLRAAGLPATLDEVTLADGRRLLRVRVGPFASAAKANAAAARVRALGLDAAAAAQ